MAVAAAQSRTKTTSNLNSRDAQLIIGSCRQFNMMIDGFGPVLVDIAPYSLDLNTRGWRYPLGPLRPFSGRETNGKGAQPVGAVLSWASPPGEALPLIEISREVACC